MEQLPDGLCRIILTRNVLEETTDDGIRFIYEEAVFHLPDGRHDTAADIETEFNAWWAYAAEEHEPPSLEDRVSVLEDVVALLMEV